MIQSRILIAYTLLFLLIFIPFSSFTGFSNIHLIAPETPVVPETTDPIKIKYNNIKGNSKLAYDLFERGFNGYLAMKNKGVPLKKELLTLIDFRLSSNKKRMWVIDLKQEKILYNTFVAHGKNSGNEYAKVFSNEPESYKSSLGFYLTTSTYYGKHGLSLRLQGLEKSINDLAYQRAIVMHGADYATPEFIQKHGRLGRSFGCPAIPADQHQVIINTLKEGTCLFAFYPDSNYLNKSWFL